ncbi:hypothetical protein ACSBR1_032611 [Camellia fascicularis]
MTSAMRVLLYGVAANTVDDYVRIGESTAIKSLKHFCNSIKQQNNLNNVYISCGTILLLLLLLLVFFFFFCPMENSLNNVSLNFF